MKACLAWIRALRAAISLQKSAFQRIGWSDPKSLARGSHSGPHNGGGGSLPYQKMDLSTWLSCFRLTQGSLSNPTTPAVTGPKWSQWDLGVPWWRHSQCMQPLSPSANSSLSPQDQKGLESPLYSLSLTLQCNLTTGQGVGHVPSSFSSQE